MASLLVLSSALVLVFAACKTESAAPTTSYTITVEPRGGTGVEASYTVQDGQTVNIPDPKKDNNKFLGWCYTADGNSVDFVSGQTNIDGNKTIYALWQQTVFKVTVDGNGVPLGTYTGGTYNNGDTIPVPTGTALPVKTDYEIAYWSKTKDVYSDHFEFGTSPVTSDMTLYPHWRYSIAKVGSLLAGNWNLPQTARKMAYIITDTAKVTACYAYVTDTYGDNATYVDVTSGPDILATFKATGAFNTSTVKLGNTDITVYCEASRDFKLVYSQKDQDFISFNVYGTFDTFPYFSLGTTITSTDNYTNNFILNGTENNVTNNFTATRIP